MANPGLRHRLQSPGIQQIMIILVALLALVSVIQGVRLSQNAIRSQDLQWSGERLLFHHIDPWAEYLRGDPEHRLILTQIPNYLPVLYLLIIPIGFMTIAQSKIAWVLCNLIFALASGVLAGRFYGLRGKLLYLTICFFMMSTPTRVTLGNGQQGLLVLFLWCLSLLSVHLTDLRSSIAGISCFKFNFAPAIVFYLFLRGGFRAVLFCALPSVIATAILWLWLSGGRDPHLIGRLIVEPLAVSQHGYFPSGIDPNLMDVLQTVLVQFKLPQSIVDPFTLVVASVICFGVLLLAMRRFTNRVEWHLALMALMSVSLFRHHDYDGVVLIMPLAYAIRRWRDGKAQVILALGAFIWYGQRILDALKLKPHHEYIVDWAALMVMLVFLYRLGSLEEPHHHELDREEDQSNLVPQFASASKGIS